jgi:endonuclease/exonuclease/phosphatase family metal-dependent hydrolase
MDTILRIVTYNILHPGLATFWKTPEGLQADLTTSNWDARCTHITHALSQLDADIICLQETDDLLSQQITAGLNAVVGADGLYALAGTALNPHIKYDTAYGTALLYKTTRLQAIKTTAIESKNNGRCACAGLFSDLANSKQITALSCHIEGYNLDAPDEPQTKNKRRNGWHELHSYIEQLDALAPADSAMVIAGDLNEDDRFVGDALSRCDLLRAHDYGTISDSRPTYKSTKLDWVFCKHAQLKSCHPIESADSLKGSDHLPLCVELAF